MDRRRKKVIIMAAALLLLVGAYIATMDIRPDIDWHAQEEPELPRIIERDEDVRVVALHIDNGYDIRLARDEESLEWYSTDHIGLRLNQITVLTIAFSVLNLPYHDYIPPEQITDLNVFGLGEGASRVTADYTDGTREVLYVGNRTPDGRFHYARLDGDDTVYLIDVRAGRRMFYSYNNMLNRDLPSPSLTALEEIEFFIGDDHFHFIPGPPTGVDNFGWMRDEFISHGVGLGKRLDMNFGFHSVFEPLSRLRIDSVIIDADVENDLARFGLLEPASMMRLVDTDGTVLHFYVGYETEEGGQRYFMLAGDPFVYTGSATILDRFEAIDRTRVFQRRITDVIVAQAETVRVHGMGRDVTLRPNSVTADESRYRTIFGLNWDSYIDPIDLSGTPVVWTLELDGHILEENIFPRQLEYITEGNFTVQPDGSIRYRVVYTFHVFDDLFYAISRDGGQAVTAISRNTVDRVFNGL